MKQTTDPSATKSQKLADWTLIVVFIIAIFLPLGDNLLHLDPFPALTENRRPAPWPGIKAADLSSILVYPKSFEAFYNDHLGFRQALIQSRSMLMMNVLRVSPSPQVILGKDDWLYLRSENNFDYYQNGLFTPDELATLQHRLEANRDILARHGIHYLVVIAPDKETIYPEFVPDELLVRRQSRFDQLLTYLREHQVEVDILDLRPALKQAKASYPVYGRADTHWNDYGAFIAYQEITRRLNLWFPQIQPAALTQFKPVTKNSHGFDLFILSGLDSMVQNERLELVPHVPRAAHLADPNVPLDLDQIQTPPFALEVANEALPRAVVFHDSFMDRLRPFLAENFSRTAFFHILYYHPDSGAYESPAQIIEREHPDVVIDEFVERRLQLGVKILNIQGD